MKKYSREAISPELTPLIDIIFLLLTFFLVSTMFKQDEKALNLNLPTSSHFDGNNNPKGVLSVELTKKQMSINGKPTTIEKSDELFKEITDKGQTIEVRIDKQVAYEEVIKLLDKLKQYELVNINLITTKR